MKDKLYDGKTPIPSEGTLECDLDFVTFRSRSKKFNFPYSDILSLEKLGKEYRMEIRNPADKFVGFMLVFHSEEVYKTILANQSIRKGSGIFSLWLNSKFVVKIAVLLVTAVIAFFTYSKVTSYAYVLVPLGYDKEQSKIMSGWLRDYLPECKSPSLNSAVKKISSKLKEKDDPFEYDIIIVDKEVFNAFAMPGGTIVLFTDLISKTDSPEELAGVMAHEMAHIHKRHGVRRQIRSAANVVLLSMGIGAGFEGVDTLENMDTLYEVIGVAVFDQKFSREYESEADEIALDKLKNSKIGASGFLSFFERLKEEYETPAEGEENKTKIPDFMSSHPSTDDRIQNVKNAISIPGYPKGGLGIGRKEWNRIKNLCDPSTPPKQLKMEIFD
ncbi:M48 family metallopeptidase [Leptospira wolffii]|uniref:M48 family metallopeptidase n=1 Tax=Leptospira wolffii TaxID=409998 RepID=A0ABV5BMX6_9LEPT|nr:M48 family metallopeptidase [Leptospira wolffii]TGL52498.1 M48 family metallopeptidase [Leptospira wolffii]